MKTPSPYPVLDNRPIDQWKVTELKEELKRRKLATKGLKDDLVRRLDEALRHEIESVKVDVGNDSHATPETVVPAVHTDDIGVLDGTPQPMVQNEDVGVIDGTSQPVENVDGEGKTVICEEIENTKAHANGTDNKGNSGGVTGVNEESVVLVTSVKTSIVVNEVSSGEGVLQDGKEIGDVGSAGNEETVTVSIGDEAETQLENHESGRPQVSEISTDVAFQVNQLEAEVAKPLHDDVKLDSSDPSNQVSEVSTVLGFQVKSDSISSDCISINQNNELKDNIIADNIKLELDVKHEMVKPSSSDVLSDRSIPHLMDVEDPCDIKEPVKEGDENADLEMSKKNYSLDVGLSEKLNLDRSSGDDSMDDERMENKPIDSKLKPEGVGDQGDKFKGSVIEEDTVVMSISADTKEVEETKKVPVAPLVKRKLNDHKMVGNNEISKRQRRWNTENLKVPESQGSSATPKDMLPPTTLKRNFSNVGSTASEGIPKERAVPPSPKSPTTSLRIDQFVRPFTLKAVQELLGKTGSVTSFWMDHIKTHCYVSYSSVEEAIETRNAVYNLQWPANGGRFLLAEYVDPQEVKTRAEATPPSTTTPVMPPQPSRQMAQKQQPLAPPPSLPLPPPPLSNLPQTRERLPPPPPVEDMEKMDTPIVTLDDLFRKTKTTPRIYYLPLSDEQVVAKHRNTRL